MSNATTNRSTTKLPSKNGNTRRRLFSSESLDTQVPLEQLSSPFPLAILGTLTLVLVQVEDSQFDWLGLARLAASPLMLGMICLVASVLAARSRLSQLAHSVLVVISAVTPFAVEQFFRMFGIGFAFELQSIGAIQAVGLFLAWSPKTPQGNVFAGLLSSFSALFCVLLGTSWPVYVSAAFSGIALLWWLMARYWERIQKAHAATNVERKLPWRFLIIAGCMGLTLALAATIRMGSTRLISLAGFMPTSGGQDTFDQYARSGVGDGDALVGGKDDASSFGPVESELFLDSEKPSLYDMYNDMYGEPFKINMRHERKIGLGSDTQMSSNSKATTSQKSSREFSLQRRRGGSQRKYAKGAKVPALLYLVGKTPNHLKMETFDLYEENEWKQSVRLSPKNLPEFRLSRELGKPWIHFSTVEQPDYLRGTSRYVVKIINLKSQRIPAPPGLSAVHIDKVDRENFFGWTADHVVEMSDRDHIPQLTVIHEQASRYGLHSLRMSDFSVSVNRMSRASDPNAEFWSSYPNDHPLLNRLATESTRDIPRGWLQVEAVVKHLRENFQVDSESRYEDSEDPLANFLRERKGPDYLFATSAALALRSLGYQTRFVSGFYVPESNFDAVSRQTTVLPENVHVWLEVRVDGAGWIPVEPTPGFELNIEELSISEAFAFWIVQASRWMQMHWPLVVAIVAGILLAFETRLVWINLLLTLFCWLMGIGSVRRRLTWTLKLIEWRSALQGTRRPVGTPISTWYRQVTATSPENTKRNVSAFVSLIERQLYAPLSQCHYDLHEVSRVCWKLALTFSPQDASAIPTHRTNAH